MLDLRVVPHKSCFPWSDRFENSGLRALQLRIFLNQLLQSKPRKLYRNLGIFPIPFSLIDRTFAIFRMADLLAGAEAALAGGFLGSGLGEIELLATRREKLGYVLDRVVRPGRRG